MRSQQAIFHPMLIVAVVACSLGLPQGVAGAQEESDRTLDYFRAYSQSVRAEQPDRMLNESSSVAQSDRRDLILLGIDSLSGVEAARLAESNARHIWLLDLVEIEQDVVETLAGFSGEGITLGLRTLTNELAEIFAKASCSVAVPNLTELTEEQADWLAYSLYGIDIGRNEMVLETFRAAWEEVDRRVEAVIARSLELQREYVERGVLDFVNERTIFDPYLESLDFRTASVMKMTQRRTIRLDSLRELDPQVARVLSLQFQRIHLPGLEAPSAELITALTTGSSVLNRPHVLHLDGVQRLTDELAEAFAQLSLLALHLGGLETIEPAHAERLTSWEVSELYLGLPELDPEIAAIIARWHGLRLQLGHVHELSEASARALASWRGGTLALAALERLEPDVAAALAQWVGFRLMLGVTELSAETYQALSSWDGYALSFPRLESMSVATSEVIGQVEERDRLPNLELNGLRELTPEVATHLGEYPAEFLELNGLVTLNAATAEALTENPNRPSRKLLLDGLRTLDAETATFLARWRGTQLDLNGVQEIDAATAEALAQWTDPDGQSKTLSLDLLTRLTPEAAAALAQWKGDTLNLGLETLDVETATALAGFSGRSLNLIYLHSLDVESARALVQTKAERINLAGIERISDEVIAVLAEFEGQLHMKYHILAAIEQARR